jgi:two-component system sensor histidine kinase AlgZ
LSAGIAFFVARGLLGLHPARVIVPSVIQLFALYASWVTVRDTTSLLFTHAGQLSARAAKAQADLQEARLQALQARMKPHFLFNALNTVAALVRTDPAAAERTVEDLSGILRSTLARDGRAIWTLDEELALVRAYIGVEQRRLGDRLTVSWRIMPNVLRTPVPVLSLQPLVENAIVHGIAARIDGGAVSIVAEEAFDGVRVAVENTGDGPSVWKEGIGLGNLRGRLASLYGKRASLTIDAGPPAIVAMVVPFAPHA